jgi:hypothetical protein
MNHGWASMTAAKGGIRLAQLLDHFAHLAHREEITRFDGSLTSHICQGMFLPYLAMPIVL